MTAETTERLHREYLDTPPPGGPVIDEVLADLIDSHTGELRHPPGVSPGYNEREVERSRRMRTASDKRCRSCDRRLTLDEADRGDQCPTCAWDGGEQ